MRKKTKNTKLEKQRRIMSTENYKSKTTHDFTACCHPLSLCQIEEPPFNNILNVRSLVRRKVRY